MIFTQAAAKQILAGRKVQHRIPRERKAPEVVQSVPVSYREPNPALGFRDGKPRQATIEVCRIVILKVEAGLLGEVSEMEAKAEGFSSRRDMLAWIDDPTAPVWIIRFRVDPTHRPRLLARRVVAGHQGDYTNNPFRAMDDEPESVDPITLAEFTEEARARDRARAEGRILELDELPFTRQVERCVEEARRRHIDIRSETRALFRFTDPAVKARKLEQIKAKLYRQEAA